MFIHRNFGEADMYMTIMTKHLINFFLTFSHKKKMCKKTHLW